MSEFKASDVLIGGALTNSLQAVPDWTLGDGNKSISRRMDFTDFAAAFAFMTRVADYAERIDHHPEWCNVWNRVDMTLTTHSVGGLTRKDMQFARHVDELLGQFTLVCNADAGDCGGCR